tara:strand:- start:425 stop:1351 length:927 start_codon:yes stop_codon:yes gene_type:complete
MNIAFFTEGGYEGKVPRNHPNIRTDMAWVCSLDATHHPIPKIHTLPDNLYDVGIIIIPKNRRHLLEYPLVENMKRICKKVSAMQEAVLWYWQDSPVDEQVWYFNTLSEMDFLFVHNELDKHYFNGLTNLRCEILPSVIIEDGLVLSDVKDRDVIIGGNFVSIYSGFDSMIVSQELSDEVWAPSMGRRQPLEEQVVNHLPYMEWSKWIYELSRFKAGVFPTANVAAGQFALNCSFVGIPCVGYESLDAQRILHPNLTVPHYHLDEVRKKVKMLKQDQDFYNECVEETEKLYKKLYVEKVFVERIMEILK